MPAITIPDLNRAKQDVDHIADVATSTALTATDRLGNNKPTVLGAVNTLAAFNVRGAFAGATAYALKDVYVSAGIAYVAVIAHVSTSVAADLASGKVTIHQGATREDLALINGMPMFGYPGLEVQEVLDDAKPMQSYTALRAYTGRASGVRLTSRSIAGTFQRDKLDASSTDNGGTVIVDAAGRRWKRLFSSAVDVRWFGAVGDGNSHPLSGQFGTLAAAQAIYPHATALTNELDWAAMQAAINAIPHVDPGFGVFRMSASLTLKGTTHFLGRGVNGANKSLTLSTTLEVLGNFPAFLEPDTFYTGHIDGVIIWYGDTVPLDIPANDQKIGLKFTALSWWPQFSKFSNIVVKGGLYSLYDTTGTYQTKYENIFSWNCQYGFHKANGTTTHFESCFAQGGSRAFWLDSIVAPVLTNCASDQLTIANTIYGGVTLTGCRGFVINGWDCESNIQQPATPLFCFISSVGQVSGIVGYNNTMQTEAGKQTDFIRNMNGSVISFSGIAAARNPGDLVVVGTGGTVSTLATNSASNKIKISGSDMRAPTGGTPTSRFSLIREATDTIQYAATKVDLVSAAYEVADHEEGTFAPALAGFTVTGAPIVTGKYARSGKVVFWNVSINPNGGTIASVAGTSVITGITINPVELTAFTAANNASGAVGNGVITSFGAMYPPAWVASGLTFVLSGTFQVG